MRCLAFVILIGCGTDAGSESVPLFPADWATTMQQVRDCRSSSDHDLQNIRVVANDLAREAYLARTAPIPEGGLLLKPQYDFADDTCTGEIQQWTLALRDDSVPKAQLGWRWQRVSADGTVVSDNDPTCIHCHANCVGPDDGVQYTCAVP